MFETPLTTLAAELADIRANAIFVRTALKARPIAGGFLHGADWQNLDRLGQQQLLSWVNQKATSIDAVHRGLYALLAASLERFFKRVIVEVIDLKCAAVKSFDDLDEPLKKRNMQVTGQILSHVFEPPDEVDLDPFALCSNLGTCVTGAKTFKFNSEAFAMYLPQLTPAGLERALNQRLNISYDKFWDEIGIPKDLQKVLGTKGPRETGKRMYEFMKEFIRQRNRVVHGAAGQVTISETQLDEAINVLGAFCTSLASFLSVRCRNA
jgi:hypothetical protein